MKKKIAILTTIFVLFLVIGTWYNMTPGRYFGGEFWKLKDGGYSHYDNSIRQTSEHEFELHFAGNVLTANLSETEDSYRVDFSDGWAVESESLNSKIMMEVGGVLLTGTSEYIITDMDVANLRFGSVIDEVHEPFYDENGNKVGESVYFVTETGESVGWREEWYDKPEWSSPEQETIVLHDGVRLTYEDLNRNLFVNEEGEYLLNAQDVRLMRMSDLTWRDRGSVAAMLVRMASVKPAHRGEISVIFLYALIYLLGAAQFLWPQKLAFLGSRWKFQTEPELSDAGLFMAQLGGIIVMVAGIVLLFAPMYT